MSNKVVVFGTGSFAQVVHFYLTHDSDYEVVAFTVHDNHLTGKKLFGLPVVAFEELERHYPPDAYNMYVAVGYKNVNRVRAMIYDQAKEKGYKLISYLSSKCIHWGDTIIGDNCFIEDISFQPFVKIGNDVVILSGSNIAHHSTIGDHCFLSINVTVAGFVQVGPYCFLGANATLRDCITIGESCVVGAGSLIMNSTEPKEVYIADRTKPYRKTSDEIRL